MRREQRTLLPPGKIVFAPPRSKSRNVGAVSFGPGVLAGCGPVEASVRVYSVRNKPAPRDGCWHLSRSETSERAGGEVSFLRATTSIRDDQSRCTAHRDLGYGQDCCQRRRGDILFLFFRSWRSWSQRWSIAPLTSGSARRWRSRALCCQAAPASKQS